MLIGLDKQCFILHVFFSSFQGLLGAFQVSVNPKYLLITPGKPAMFMCKVNGPLDSCHFTVGNMGYNLRPNKEKDGMMYVGDGLAQGECGLLIQRTEEKHNGNITCSVSLNTNDPTESHGYMRLVVAYAPEKVDLEVRLNSEDATDRVFKERDLLTATCTVRDSRPASNLTWYLGKEKITEGLRIPVETCTSQQLELCTVQQNFTRVIKATDDKKELTCVSDHYALREKQQVLTQKYTINVHYPPKASPKPFEHFGLVEGSAQEISITVEANPKPVFHWSINGDQIYEDQTVKRFTVKKSKALENGKYESTLVIEDLAKTDTDLDYRVVAHNELGEQTYIVSISTSPEPEVLEMEAGLIAAIIAAIILILIIIGAVFYARAKGKFCFAVDDRKSVAPNEGTENPAVNHHASSEYINNSPELKKEKPKEDTPV